MMAAVKETGSREGLDFCFDKMRFGDTTDAHAMVKSIDSFEKRQQLIGVISHASMAEGKDIFDRRVLSALAIGQGLASHEFSFDARHLASVARDERDAKLLDAGVPLVVFNDNIVLSGAQEISVFQKAMREAATFPHAYLEWES